MSAEPKRAEELASVLHPDAFNRRAQSATGYAAKWFEAAATRARKQAERAIAAGWVSPEEAKAREAAARREALLAFADTRGVNVGDEDSEWLRGYRQAQRECLRDATDAALAEPERDEEGGR